MVQKPAPARSARKPQIKSFVLPADVVDESIAEAHATIARVAAERLAAGDDPANDDDE